MNDKPKGTTLSKQRLGIDNVEIDVPYSQGTKQLDRIHAANLSLPEDNPLHGKPLRFTVFNGELKTFIRGKNSIVADVEERPRPESEYGPDRTIVQVYDDQGQPVSRKQPGGGGGGWKRSLEDDLALEAFKRVSIEGQTAVAQVGERLGDILKVPPAEWPRFGLDEATWKRVLAKYWKAVEKGLDNYLAPTPTVSKPASAPGSPSRKAQDGQGTAQPPAQVSSDQGKAEAPSFKNFGELLTRANKLSPPVSRAELMGALGLKEGSPAPNLAEAWKKAQAISAGKLASERERHPTDDGKTSEQAWADLNRK